MKKFATNYREEKTIEFIPSRRRRRCSECGAAISLGEIYGREEGLKGLIAYRDLCVRCANLSLKAVEEGIFFQNGHLMQTLEAKEFFQRRLR